MTDNIFDLSKIVTPSNDVEAKPIDEVNQEALLLGYDLTLPIDWKSIPYGSYIRYLRKDGSFRKGGIVQGVWANTDKIGNEIVKIDIMAGYGTRTTKWSITSNNIEKIWVKKSQQTQLQSQSQSQYHADNINELREDVDMCKESIKHLTKEIQKIQTDVVRVIALIKKLHNLK